MKVHVEEINSEREGACAKFFLLYLVEQKMKDSIIFSIVYDNQTCDPKFKNDWGFGCYVHGFEKSILFDTGRDGNILLSNLQNFQIQPDDIDIVVLSHEHGDHTGGLVSLLELKPNIEVWLPKDFPKKFKDDVLKSGAKIVEAKDFTSICKGAYTTGIIRGWIKEQSLLLDTENGFVLLTGCAHPRITNIISQLRTRLKRDIKTVLGGFHLAGFDEKEIKDIIKSFRSFGVERVGPCHCSGEKAQELFHREYRNNYLVIGTGKRMTLQ